MKARVWWLVLWAGVSFFPSPASASIVFTFHGQADLSQKQFNVVLDFPPTQAALNSSAEQTAPAALRDERDRRSSVALSGSRISPQDYRLSLDVEHLKTPLFDLLGKIESSIEILPGSQETSPSAILPAGGLPVPSLKGKVWSQNSLIDYHPVRELDGQFEVKDNQLVLNSVSFGNLNCRGSMELTYPYKMDLTFKLQGVVMKDFLNFWVKDNQYDSSGTVSGEIGVSGTWDRLSLKGSLESYDGYIEELEYNTIHLNAEGIYPKMRILDSTLSKNDGVSMTFSGPFDLSNQENFQKQISALVFAPLVSGSLTEGEWTIKRVRQPKAGSTEIKYLFRKDDKLGGESDMFGVQQRMEF